jgi:membrane-bound serine protease (ClpP class)
MGPDRRLPDVGRAWCALALTLATATVTSAPTAAVEGATIVLRLDGSIQAASGRYLERGLAEARKRGAALVVVELNTPGGTLLALREMTAAITSATVPVAVYVTPAGARAASAGFFLLLASDYAAMAPGTNAGAAHPVALGRRGAAGEKAEPEARKAINDAAALARSLAAQRSRPVKLAEEAVTDSRAFSAREALDRKLIDSGAPSREQLLAEIDGRTIHRFDGREERVVLRPEAVEVLPPTLAERVLMKVADPEIAYLLLMLGGAALLIELLHPGLIVPGVVGGIAVLLALYAFSVLPVSFVGASLLLAALALFVAEAFVTSFGFLAIGGLLCFVLGSMMLFETGEQPVRLSLTMVLPVALVVGTIVLVLVSRVIKARRAPSPTGAQALIGTEGEVVVSLGPSGTVLVHGEYWDAVAPSPLSRGARVRVTGVSGRRLSVDTAGSATEEGGM